MKMSDEHFKALRTAIHPFDVPDRRVLYIKGAFPNADRVQDLNKRYRWDLFWVANRMCPNIIAPILDAGYLDAHIDTALRKIVPPIPER